MVSFNGLFFLLVYKVVPRIPSFRRIALCPYYMSYTHDTRLDA